MYSTFSWRNKNNINTLGGVEYLFYSYDRIMEELRIPFKNAAFLDVGLQGLSLGIFYPD